MRKIVSLLTVMLLTCSMAWSQSRTINGTVKDQDGNMVPFATVNIKGTKVSTAVSSTGTFKIAAKTGDVLVLSAINYATTEFTVGNDDNVSITMPKTGGNLADVVVTTALGVQKQQRSLGYATTKISGSELTQAKVTNAATGLAGKVAGLQITLVNNSVKPSVRANIRGVRSFLGNNQPLLVVDGAILPLNYLATINPNDIENQQILNGASAAALYGSQGSNGVIIVTTKRGAKGKAQVTFSSTVSSETLSYLPEFQNRFGPNGGEFDPASFAGIVYFPEDPFRPYVPYENQNYGAEYNGRKVPIGPPIYVYAPDGSYSIQQDSIAYSAKPGAKLNFFDKGLTVQNDISLSAGDDKSRFYMSFQDVSAKGIIEKDKNHRNTLRVGGTRELGKFRADYSIGYTIDHTNTTPGTFSPFRFGNSGINGNFPAGAAGSASFFGGGGYFQGRPVYWQVINQPANVDLRDYRNWQTDPFASPDGYFNAYYGNPWWQIDQTRLDERTATLLGSATLNFKATDWLNFTYRLSASNENYNNKYTKAGYDFAPWAERDTLGSGNIPSSVKKFDPTSGDAFSVQQSITNDLLATFSKTFFEDFDVTFIAGNQIQSQYFRSMGNTANALIIPDFYNISNRSGEPTVGEFYSAQKSYGVFGDLSVGYKKVLYGHFSLRNDWTSLLPKENRSFLYPGGDVAFIFTELLKDNSPSWLSYGKVRGALSKVGQVNIGPYATENIFDVGGGFPYGAQAGFSVNNTLANPDLKPEFTYNKEVGLELGLFKDRINLSLALYKTNTKNQTIPLSISGTTGFTTAVVNSGEMENKGVEVTAKATVIKTPSGFRWDVGGNYSYNKNTVLFISDGIASAPIPGTNSFIVQGMPYSQVQVVDWQRDDQNRIIVDKNTGKPVGLDPNPKNFGTAYYPTRVGVTTTLSWKGFTLTALADGRFGAVIYNDIGQDLDFTGVSAYSTQSGRQAFVIPNSSYDDGTGKYVANTSVTTTDGNLFWAQTWNQAQSPYVNSADFWKLREVALTYEVPQSLLAKSRFAKSVTFGVVGRNLAVVKASQNVWTDPEFANTAGNGLGTTDINQTPPTRYLGGTITITF